MKIQKIFKGGSIVAALLFAASVALASCSGSGYGGGGGGNGGPYRNPSPRPSLNPTPSPSPSPSPTTASTQSVVVRLVGENAASDPTYGNILGYQNGSTGSTSQIIHLTANMPVQFTNMDASLDHTASFIGMWAGSYPGTFPATNLGATAAAAGTAISQANFSSGNLTAGGGTSSVFTSGGAGILIFGCAYHYQSSGMRTVVIVQ
ncbi:MAG: hypothetical protein M3007_06865 [Candidatus Eremiobacteraeota bacterium]|nr:hypothetical protein [Candidatus Eremiobacteraeota bacterium]